MTKFCGDCTYTDVVQVNMLNISTISSSQHRVEIYLLYLSLATNEWYTIKMWHQTKIRLFPCIIHVKHIHLCGWHWDMNDTWSHDVCDTVINGRVTQNTKGPKMLWLRTTFWWNYISWMKRILHKLQKWRNNGESSLHIWSDVSKQR